MAQPPLRPIKPANLRTADAPAPADDVQRLAAEVRELRAELAARDRGRSMDVKAEAARELGFLARAVAHTAVLLLAAVGTFALFVAALAWWSTLGARDWSGEVQNGNVPNVSGGRR
jgi:hypothetical protein